MPPKKKLPENENNNIRLAAFFWPQTGQQMYEEGETSCRSIPPHRTIQIYAGRSRRL